MYYQQEGTLPQFALIVREFLNRNLHKNWFNNEVLFYGHRGHQTSYLLNSPLGSFEICCVPGGPKELTEQKETIILEWNKSIKATLQMVYYVSIDLHVDVCHSENIFWYNYILNIIFHCLYGARIIA
jgi:hypothetical protein